MNTANLLQSAAKRAFLSPRKPNEGSRPSSNNIAKGLKVVAGFDEGLPSMGNIGLYVMHSTVIKHFFAVFIKEAKCTWLQI